MAPIPDLSILAPAKYSGAKDHHGKVHGYGEELDAVWLPKWRAQQNG